MQDFITTSIAARILQVSEAAVRNMASRGAISFERTEAGFRLYHRADVERLAAERASK